MASIRGTRGDYRHYPPSYPQAGIGIIIDNTDPVHPIINGTTGEVEEVVAGNHIAIDNTDPKKPIISTSGLVDKVHGTGQIVVDNTDEDNPIVRTIGLVEGITLDNSFNYNKIALVGTSENPVVRWISNADQLYLYPDQSAYIEFSGTDEGQWYFANKGKMLLPNTTRGHGPSISQVGGEAYINHPGVYTVSLSLTCFLTGSTKDEIELYIGLGQATSPHSNKGLLLNPYRTPHVKNNAGNVNLAYTTTQYINSGAYLSPILYVPLLGGGTLHIRNEWYHSGLQVCRIA